MWGGALLSLKITINSQQSLDVAVTFQFPVDEPGDCESYFKGS